MARRLVIIEAAALGWDLLERCGKTRMALEMARRLLPDLPDGAWFADLAPLTDPDLVPQAVAQALGVGEDSFETLVEALAGHLESKTALVVLDNCEHLVGACAVLAESLLRSCPDLRLLATSQEALGIAGEIVYQVLTYTFQATLLVINVQ